MSAISGGCLCGHIRYEISGKADSTCHCHCAACRQTTGAAVSTWTTVTIESFHVTQGELGTYHSSEMGTRQFCPVCGSQITFYHKGYTDYLDVTVNSLDRPGKMPPGRHIWAKQQVSWALIDSHLPSAQEE